MEVLSSVFHSSGETRTATGTDSLRQLRQRVSHHLLVGPSAKITAAFPAGNGITPSVLDNFGNVVELTASAVDEIRRRHSIGNFDADVVVRVTPDRSLYRKIMIQFDFALADGSDWIGQSHGIPIVVDRDVAPELWGCTIDFRDGYFVRS